jgi:N-acetylglucosaminyldiphosphoundecaprenol N-acetyl-beta-D-mannosaminyltransferase
VPSSIEILGVPVQALTWPLLREEIVRRIAGDIRSTVMYANIHVVNTAQRVPALLDALRAADIVYCDGDGVRLGARILGERLPERITGAEFIWDLARTLAAHDASIYWIGGSPGVARDALARLAERTPGLRIAGSHDGFFAKHGPETDEVISRINTARPSLLVVGMGTPIQEEWVMAHRDHIAAPLVWCIGATADFITGAQVRAPAFMAKSGLEWLHRLVREPRRMFGRYVIGNPLFLSRIVRERLGR